MKRFLALLLCLLFPLVAGAQSPTPHPLEAELNQGPFQVQARLERDHWQLGESVRLVYHIQAPSAANITFPATEKLELKPFDVKDGSVVTLPGAAEEKVYELRLKITAYETGNLTLPELQLPVKLPGEGGTSELRTPTLQATVERVPAGPDDKPDQVRDAKGLDRTGIPPVLLLAAALALLLALGLLRAFWLWLRRPRRAPAPPPLAPYPWALREWQQLHDERPYEKGEWEAFYDRLTHLLRFYLGWRFGLPLLELTSSEILRAVSLPDADHRALKEILDAGDLVKFARNYPDTEQAARHLQHTKALLEAHPPAEGEEKKG